MTEAEWLECSDPERMLRFLSREIVTLVDEQQDAIGREQMRRFLSGVLDPRKIRLFAFACCRLIWNHLVDVRSRNAIEVGENYLDGSASYAEWSEVILPALEARNAVGISLKGADRTAIHSARVAAHAALMAAYDDVAGAFHNSTDVAVWSGNPASLVRAEQARLLHDIFGNPFRPVAIKQSWQSPAVAALAQAIYDRRAFHEMPDLAEALKATGCTDTAILTHCRGPGPHVRGCWVLDLILEKK